MAFECVASHYSGCGNDFLLLDNREGKLSSISSKIIQDLCNPVDVDGLILVSSSKNGDAAMKFFNRDGTEAEMCGNGVRCLMQFMRQKLAYPRLRCLLETMKRDILVSCEGSDIVVHIGKVIELGWDIALDYMGVPYHMHYLNSGVPHVVIFVDNVEAVDVDAIGRHFRYHPHFAPAGTNVNFVEHIENSARIRTYERGVEAETLACGTGVSAAAYALFKMRHVQSPIKFQVQSGEWLTVLFEPHDEMVENLALKGAATWIQDCNVTIDLEKNRCTLQYAG